MRKQLLDRFLEQQGLGGAKRIPLAGDASSRRYERITGGCRSLILMDAPPPGGVRAFIAIDRELAARGYSAPKIFAEDPIEGFLLLEDLGDGLFAALIAAGEPEPPLYQLAVDFLIDLQKTPPPSFLPPFSDDYVRDQNDVFLDYYVAGKLGAPLEAEPCVFYKQIWEELLPALRAGPEVFLLRDFHSENLLLLPDREGLKALGLLDFQDALRGPAAYDLVSLLQDARRGLDAYMAEDMIYHYLDETGMEEEEFRQSYAILGAHRALRIMGIFTRLAKEQGKTKYLDLIPRMQGYLAQDLGHPALSALRNWLDLTIGEGK
ncbi:MAG: phosphotransferase [Sneathiella sp.]|nr:phosphotransferase [Sneathiella sp.]